MRISKKRKLKESSLSRIISKFTQHDTGCITAFRDKYSLKENKARNFSLKQKLFNKGYGITEVDGGYIENFGESNATEVSESTLFVEDLKDKCKLKKDLIELGEEFDQDSIMFIPKVEELKQIGKSGLNVSSYIIGTKDDPNMFFKYHKEYKQPFLKLGKEDYQFLTRVGNRPFYFKESVSFLLKEVSKPAGSNSGRYGHSLGAKEHWTYYLDRFDEEIDEKIVKEYNGRKILLESSLNKIKQHTDNSFFIISAFRGEYDYNKNLQRHDNLKKDLIKEKLGFIEMYGKWIENKDTPNEKLQEEVSLFVPYNPNAMSNDEFVDYGIDLMFKYDQDAIVIKEQSKEILIVDQDQNIIFDIGFFHADKIAEVYSTLKYGKHAGRNFIFEGCRVPSGWVNARSMKEQGYIL
jgi:hypothetical protein